MLGDVAHGRAEEQKQGRGAAYLWLRCDARSGGLGETLGTPRVFETVTKLKKLPGCRPVNPATLACLCQRLMLAVPRFGSKRNRRYIHAMDNVGGSSLGSRKTRNLVHPLLQDSPRRARQVGGARRLP